MAQIETWLNQEMTQAVKVRYLDGNLFSMDNAGNLIGVTLTKNGTDYSGGGSVSANVIRADGGTVAVTGALSGNVATVVLPQAAYAVPGIVSIIVKLTVNGEITTIAAVVANVYQSSTDTAVDPGTIIPSVQTLIAEIEAVVNTIPQDYSALCNVYAETVGDFEYVTKTSSTRNIYGEREMALVTGDVVIVNVLSWSQNLSDRSAINIYVFDSNSASKKIGEIADLNLPSGYYYFTVPADDQGNPLSFVKVRVACQNVQNLPAGDTTVTTVIGKKNDSYVLSLLNRYTKLKINCFGDSLTYGYVPSGSGTSPMSPGWVSQLATDFGCTVRNYGITNNAVSNNTGGTGDPMCIRYTTMDNDADVVIVMGGTNDFLRVNAPLGTIDSMDNTTFYGAYNVLVQGLIGKYAARKTRIILMIPPMRNRSTEHNTQGTTLQQIQQAVRDIANKYALPYVDWAYDAGISAYLISTDTDHVYTYDGIHITQDIVLGWILPMIEAKIKEVV